MRKPPKENVWAAAGVGPTPGTDVITMQPNASAALAKNRRLRDPHVVFAVESKFPLNAIISILRRAS